MITGFNTDIKHKGVVYHVQTEDKGTKNPKVETLIYRGGIILYAKRTPYNHILKADSVEDIVTKLMEEQHQNMIKEIKAGKFDEDREDTFAADLISDRSLDEVILDYLTSEKKIEKENLKE
ncbi:hypothetical protein ACFL27_16350 [candidate division CSSED10-310 bacterium]|uniref:Uncharacterized protein n=1 Tax=candidate division CSSED10-310 bacterium TaxID=2855610 RepID=A0ABV6YZY5_UNCC1